MWAVAARFGAHAPLDPISGGTVPRTSRYQRDLRAKSRPIRAGAHGRTAATTPLPRNLSLGTGPCGVAEWFEDGGLEGVGEPRLDERLHYRYRRDPPEFVSVFGGNSAGGHWGPLVR